MHSRPRLAAHPLAAALGPEGHPLADEQLRRLLLDAIEALRPVGSSRHDAEWRQHRQLVLRYAEGMSRDQAARAIGVSTRQASRDHERAVEALASLLRVRGRDDELLVRGNAALGGDVVEEASKLAAAEEGASEAPSLLGAARQLIEAQGGLLEVAGPPEGEEIVLVLPPVPLRAVLVVDDNPDVGSLFQRYLRGEPYRVVQATSGEG